MVERQYNIAVLVSIILLLSCNPNNAIIKVSSIYIEVHNRHEHLVDHDRMLVVIDNDGIIDKINLYSDSGSGCETYLFENDSAYTIIDCNGQWYSVNKTNGEISNIGWHWNKNLPDNSKGAFVYNKSTNKYELKDTLGIVFKYKDPKN